MPAVVHVQASRGTKDCAIVALANYLARPYEDVLATASRVLPYEAPHNMAMSIRDIKKIARALGKPLRSRRVFDLDDDEGICWFRARSGVHDHVAYVKQGLVFGMMRDTWEHGVYCVTKEYRPAAFYEVSE